MEGRIICYLLYPFTCSWNVQTYCVLCAGARRAWGHEFACEAAAFPPGRRMNKLRSGKHFSSTAPSRDEFGFLGWPTSSPNWSPASYLIEAFVLPSHNVLIVIIGPFCSSQTTLPTLTASLKCHYKTIRVLVEEKKGNELLRAPSLPVRHSMDGEIWQYLLFWFSLTAVPQSF